MLTSILRDHHINFYSCPQTEYLFHPIPSFPRPSFPFPPNKNTDITLQGTLLKTYLTYRTPCIQRLTAGSHSWTTLFGSPFYVFFKRCSLFHTTVPSVHWLTHSTYTVWNTLRTDWQFLTYRLMHTSSLWYCIMVLPHPPRIWSLNCDFTLKLWPLTPDPNHSVFGRP